MEDLLKKAGAVLHHLSFIFPVQKYLEKMNPEVVEVMPIRLDVRGLLKAVNGLHYSKQNIVSYSLIFTPRVVLC